MCIFYIDWQHYWKRDWIFNIGANAHSKRTVSTKQPQHKWQTWQSGFQWHRRDLYRASLVTRLFHSATVSQYDHFLNATCICCLILHHFFLAGGGGGGGGGGIHYRKQPQLQLSSNAFTIWWRILSSRPPRVFLLALVELNVSDSKAAITPFIYTFDYIELLVSFLCLNVRINGMVTRRVSVRYNK